MPDTKQAPPTPKLVDPADAGLDADALQRLRDRVQQDIDEGVHHGAVLLVARGGKVAYNEPIGHTDLETGRAASADDIFILMSTAKAYTACAVLRLIDRGRLSFDTRVADVIPEFGVRGKQRVTIYNLMTHTGGTWAGFVPPPPMQWGPDIADLEAWVAAISALPLAHFPGEHVVYNPFASYTLLGAIVARLDERGRSFRDILREDVFEPLGMADSSFGLETDNPRRVPLRMAEATPGAAEVEVMHSFNVLVDERAEVSAGGGFSTTGDVFRFAEMLRNDGTLDGTRILSRSLAEYALQNHTGNMSNDFWDFNKESRDIADFPAMFSLCGGYVRGTGHHLTPLGSTASPRAFGSVGSGSTMWMVDPDRELTFVFLSSGLLEGLHHFQRLQVLSDLALASVN